MKIVVLCGGLSPERNVSASTGIMVCEALRAKGHQAALVDMYFGLEDHAGDPEELFSTPLSATGKTVSPEAPDLEQVKKSRKWQSDSLFGKALWSSAKRRTWSSWPCTGPAVRTAGSRRPWN